MTAWRILKHLRNNEKTVIFIHIKFEVIEKFMPVINTPTWIEAFK